MNMLRHCGFLRFLALLLLVGLAQPTERVHREGRLLGRPGDGAAENPWRRRQPRQMPVRASMHIG